MTKDKAFRLFKDGADTLLIGQSRVSFSEVGEDAINCYIENVFIPFDSVEMAIEITKAYFNHHDKTCEIEKEHGIFTLVLKDDQLLIDAWTTLYFDELTSDSDFKQAGENLAREVFSFVQEVKSKSSI